MKEENLNIDITVQDTTGWKKRFASLVAFQDFIASELGFWEKTHKEVAESCDHQHKYLNIPERLSRISTTVQTWREDPNEWPQSAFDTSLAQLQRDQLQHLPASWLWSGQACTKPFVSILMAHGPQTAGAFLTYVTKRQIGNLSESSTFLGVLLGYEFEFPNSEISKRRSGEKVSLGRLREELSQQKDHLVSESAVIKSNFHDWEETTKKDASHMLDVAQRLARMKSVKFRREFDHEMTSWKARVKELERTYSELLKLKKPAEYWGSRAKRYGIQGSVFLLAMVIALAVGLLYFYEIFSTWLIGKTLSIQLNTIQGIVIFGTIAATYAYLLRTLSRLSFSAFHLMRDAEEREQLTYLYLSLMHEAEIDKDSRDIVLQALFSRSETGLLANESGPTMPGIADTLRAATRIKS